MKLLWTIIFLLIAALPLWAQQSAPPAPVGTKTLADALTKVNWDASRGVLLTVNPQSVKVPKPPPPGDTSEDHTSSPFIPELTPRGYDVHALADYFDQEVVREGGVTVLVPQTMTVLNTHPGPPNLYADLSRGDLMQLFIGTLTVAQWKQIGSEEGLGQADLTPDQQKMFEYLLPNPFVVVLRHPHQSGEQSVPDQTTPLSASERDAVRLRVTMETDVDAKTVQYPGHFPVVFDRNQRQGDKPYFRLPRDPAYSETPTVHGVKVSEKVSNRLKHGQLNLDSSLLNVPISLAPTATGKLIVGDLVARVGAATFLELYADRRVAQLPVWVKGQSARTSDVLKALCLGVCGTFRQVGPAYLLTDDVMGIWTRRALLDDWDDDAKAVVEQMKREALHKAAALHAAQYLTWSDDEPLKLSPDLLAQVMTQRSENSDELSVPLTTLTRDQQQFIQNAATVLGKEENGEYAVTTDQVILDVDTWLVFVVPGFGQIVDAPLAEPSDLMPTLPKPDLVLPLHRALIVRPASSEEAEQTVQEAKKRGFVSLWVQVPYDNNLQPLKAALQEGQKVHLPIYAVVRLLSRPPGTPDTEINIRGQPESAYMAGHPNPIAAPVDWARLDTPGLMSSMRNQLLPIAKLPGLAGLVLQDTAAPGFDLAPPYSLPYHRDGYGADVGYTLPERLAFLRQNGADPIDIVPHFEFPRSDVLLPDFPDDGEGDSLATEWFRWRYTQTQHLLAGLYQSLRTARPGLPLLMQGHLSIPGNPDLWYGSWDKRQALPQSTLIRSDLLKGLAQSAREYSHTVVLAVPAPKSGMAAADYAAAVQESLQRDGSGWDGAVLDLSDCSLDQARKYLDVVGMHSMPAPNMGDTGQK